MNRTDSKIKQEATISKDFITKIIDDARNRYNIPAIAICVMNSNYIIQQEIQGLRVYDKKDQVTLDDYFHIGSCSKSILAVIAAKLIEQNVITWCTKFFDIFPELKENSNYAYYNITLEDLFLCEAGIKAYTYLDVEPLPEFQPSTNSYNYQFIKHLVEQSPSAKMNNGKFIHLYSNASYTMASFMLEKVTGKNYRELIQKTLTDDLDIPVHIGWPNTFAKDQPWGHIITKKKLEVFPPNHEYQFPELLNPAGNLSISPRDYAKYTQLHLKGLKGADNCITSKSYHYIHYCKKGFSLGVGNGVYYGKRISMFDGSAGTFYCRSIIVANCDFAITIMMNACFSDTSQKAVDRLTLQIAKKQFNWWWMFWL